MVSYRERELTTLASLIAPSKKTAEIMKSGQMLLTFS